MSLRFRINLIVTVLVVLFTVALGVMAIDDSRRAIREEMEAGSKLTMQWLTNVLALTPFVQSSDAGSRDELVAFMNHLGRVRAHDIQVIDASGSVLYQSPPSIYKTGREAPQWFTALVAPKLADKPKLLVGICLGLCAVFVSWFVVAPIKGLPIATGWVPLRMLISLLINGAWGIGTVLIFSLLLARRRAA